MLHSETAYRINKFGSRIEIHVSKLNNSHHIVTVKCDDCGKVFETKWSNRKKRTLLGRRDLCSGCVRLGDRNPQYGKDRGALLVHARSFCKQNPMKGKFHSEETKRKMSDKKTKIISDGSFDIKSNNRGHKIKHFSIKNNELFYADSALEKLRMEQIDLDVNILSWTKRHGLIIPYLFNGSEKGYVPDFLITYKDFLVIEEIKGYVKEIDLVKKIYANEFCKKNGYIYRFITQKEMNLNGEYRCFLKKLKEDGVI